MRYFEQVLLKWCGCFAEISPSQCHMWGFLPNHVHSSQSFWGVLIFHSPPDVWSHNKATTNDKEITAWKNSQNKWLASLDLGWPIILLSAVLCLFRILKCFQCCTIFGSPLHQILWIFWQPDVHFVFYTNIYFFYCRWLCLLLEEFWCSGFKNIRILKLLSHYVTMTLAEMMMTVWQVNVTNVTLLWAKFGILLSFPTASLSLKFCI